MLDDALKLTPAMLELNIRYLEESNVERKTVSDLRVKIKERLAELSPNLQTFIEVWFEEAEALDSKLIGASRAGRGLPWELGYHMNLCKAAALQKLWDALEKHRIEAIGECDGSGI